MNFPFGGKDNLHKHIESRFDEALFTFLATFRVLERNETLRHDVGRGIEALMHISVMVTYNTLNQ